MARLTFPIVLVGLALQLGACDSRKSEGGSCEENANCADGLICQAKLCADATKVMKARTKNLERTAQKFMHDNSGNCPAIEDLGDQNERTDAWGNAFVVLCPSEHAAVSIVSNGPDGKPDTADDIPSWD